MAGLTRNRALFIGREATFGADPASYFAVPCLELGEVQDQKEILETGYATGRPFRTPHEMSPASLWTITFVTPAIGLPSAAGDGVSASTVAEDWLDLLLRSVFGAPTNTSGEGVASGTGSTVVMDTSAYGEQELLCVANATRAQWRQITDESAEPTYSIAPNWTTNPVDADVSYGVRRYMANAAQIGGGHSVDTGYVRLHFKTDTNDYNLQGGYVTSLTLTADANQMVRLAWTVQGVIKRDDLTPTLPDAISAPAVTPVKLHRSSMHFGATAIDTSSLEVAIGITAVPIMDAGQEVGIVGWQTTGMDPTIALRPLYSDALMDLRRAGTAERVMVQVGKGAFSSPAVNSVGICLYKGQISAADGGDDTGLRRNQVSIVAADPVTWEASTAARFLQFCRA